MLQTQQSRRTVTIKTYNERVMDDVTPNTSQSLMLVKIARALKHCTSSQVKSLKLSLFSSVAGQVF